MATTLEAGITGSPDLSFPAREAAADAQRASTAGDVIKSRMPGLVKGCTYAQGINQPLTDSSEILMRSAQATLR
jgi:hypothetical protein